MSSNHFRAVWLAYLLAAPLAVLAGEQAVHEVALTFDDLPLHGPLPPKVERSQVLADILVELEHARVPPTYGFINADGVEENADYRTALQLWRQAGHLLANHTYTHMSLNQNTLEAYRADVLKNEPLLERMMQGEDWRWFRYPYLHEGETPEKRRGAQAFLNAHGYNIAQVTIDFQDYEFNDPYVRCLQRGDQRAIEELRELYVARADWAIGWSQRAARAVHGRDIKHVMLLHVGAFQPIGLPELLKLLRRRNFKIVTLAQAQLDPVYDMDPAVALDYGTSLLHQMAVAKNVALQWDGPDLAPVKGMCGGQ